MHSLFYSFLLEFAFFFPFFCFFLEHCTSSLIFLGKFSSSSKLIGVSLGIDVECVDDSLGPEAITPSELQFLDPVANTPPNNISRDREEKWRRNYLQKFEHLG